MQFEAAIGLNLDSDAQVVRIDTPHGKEMPELPKKSVNYHRELAEKGWRKGLKPLTVLQPEGPSFTVRPVFLSKTPSSCRNTMLAKHPFSHFNGALCHQFCGLVHVMLETSSECRQAGQIDT